MERFVVSTVWGGLLKLLGVSIFQNVCMLGSGLVYSAPLFLMFCNIASFKSNSSKAERFQFMVW